jgi:hypothetical protein
MSEMRAYGVLLCLFFVGGCAVGLSCSDGDFALVLALLGIAP